MHALTAMHALTTTPCATLDPTDRRIAAESETGGQSPRILWLFNCVGTPDSLLYWKRLLPPLIDHFPASQFWSAFPPTKVIPGTNREIEFAGAIHLSLGKRKNSYNRQFVIPTPTIVGRIRRLQPDVIVVQEILALAVYLALFRPFLRSARILALVEGDPYQGSTRRPRWPIVALRRFACRGIDLFLTSNEQGRRYLQDTLRVPADKVRVGTFLVSDTTASKTSSPRSSVHDRQLPAHHGRVRLLYVGQLISRKGISQLIDGLAELPKQVQQELELWLVGDGDQREALQRLVAERKLSDLVMFFGRQPYERLSCFYESVDAFVMPTLDDYRALVGFEALAHGLPLLHSRYDGAHGELVCDGENGRLFDPLDTRDTADKLTWLVEQRGRLAAMSSVSRQRAERFTPATAIHNMTAAIESLLNQPQRGSSYRGTND